jgi:hypothetical protein
MHFILRYWKEWMPKKYLKDTAFLVGTCFDGRKTVVSARKAAGDLQTARCNSPSTLKLTPKSSWQRKRSGHKPRDSAKWPTSRPPRVGIASLAGDTINGKSNNARACSSWKGESGHLRIVMSSCCLKSVEIVKTTAIVNSQTRLQNNSMNDAINQF